MVKRPKSELALFLQKVADGDQGYLDKLLTRLSDRLLHVPLAASDATPYGASGSTVKLNVACKTEAHRRLIPVFTSEELLQDWCKVNGYSGQCISILGADLCATLSGAWIMVNPASETAVELQPFLVEKIAQSFSDQSAVREKPLMAPPSPGETPLYIGKKIETTPVAERLDLESPDQDELPATAGSFASQAVYSATVKENDPSKNISQKPVEKKKSFLNFLKMR